MFLLVVGEPEHLSPSWEEEAEDDWEEVRGREEGEKVAEQALWGCGGGCLLVGWVWDWCVKVVRLSLRQLREALVAVVVE
jgi:hypothetical protein